MQHKNAPSNLHMQLVVADDMGDREGVVALVLLISLIATSNAGVVSKSSKEECILENDVKTLANKTCSTKLVVSVTVTANEVA